MNKESKRTVSKQKQVKEKTSEVLKQFNEHLNDEELKRNYDGFIKTKSIIEVRVERYITQINSLQDNINKHRNCIIDTLKLGYTDISYLIGGLSQLESDLERVNEDLFKSKTELDKINSNIERYEELSERTKLTYFKLLSNSGDIKGTWLEFKEQYKDKIF
jgi:DNA repair exonuclease SbcCD ATPase subunit